MYFSNLTRLNPNHQNIITKMDYWYLNIAKIFGILPIKHLKTLRIISTFVSCAIWTTLTCIILYNIYTRDSNAGVGYVFLDTTEIILRLCIKLNIILRINLFQYNDYCHMRSSFEEFDRLTRHSPLKVRSTKVRVITNLNIILIYSIYLILEVFLCFVWMDDTLQCSCHGLSFICLLVISTLNWCIVNEIGGKFDALHKSLRNYADNTRSIHNSVSIWNKQQLHINKQIVYYNDLFGWHMFLHIVVAMLVTLNLLRDYISNEFEFSWISVTFSLVAFFQTGIAIVLVRGCNKIADSSKLTTLLAFDAADVCPIESVKKEIYRFAQQSGVQCSVCSAAGFFIIDNTVLFTMMQLITTYVIVIVQSKY